MSYLLEKLEEIALHHEGLLNMMSQPEIAADYGKVQILAKESSGLEPTVNMYKRYLALSQQKKEAQDIIDVGDDPDLVMLAEEDLQKIIGKLNVIEAELKMAILPKDPDDGRDVIVEIRKGAGGHEAGLFASDLFRMYSRYAQNRNWTIEVLTAHASDVGGYNEIVFGVKGEGVFSCLKYERGVHRVQRVPSTEASGRIHTSTATVAVLPEVEEVDVSVNPDEVRIDVFHSGGAGGQNVNKVATAIRLVHVPSGIIVSCQDERSQHKNKQKAMNILRARLYEQERRRAEQEMTKSRRSQVGSGERAEKIRTYNYPQDRVTDHRINTSFHGMQKILAGYIEDIIEQLGVFEQTRAMQEGMTV